jgi:hypothetical protein
VLLIRCLPSGAVHSVMLTGFFLLTPCGRQLTIGS